MKSMRNWPVIFLFLSGSLQISSEVHAQLVGEPVHVSACEKPHKVDNDDFITTYGPYRIGNLVYTFEYVNHLLIGKNKAYFGHIYNMDLKRCVRTVDLGFEIPENCGAMEGVIEMGGSFVVLYHTCGKKGAQVTLLAQRFSAEDLSPIGAPTVVSSNEFVNGVGVSLKLDIKVSPNGEGVLVMLKTWQDTPFEVLLKAWVLDSSMSVIWEGLYPLTYSITYGVGGPLDYKYYFADDMALYVTVVGKRSKEAKGEVPKVVRIRGKEYTEWYYEIGRGLRLGGRGLVLEDAHSYAGGFIVNDEKKGKVNEWCIVELDTDLQPTVFARGDLMGEVYDGVLRSAISIDPEGGFVLVGSMKGAVMVISVDERGGVRWMKKFPSDYVGDHYGFFHNGYYCMAMMAYPASLNSLRSGELRKPGKEREPLLLTFDKSGAWAVEEVLPIKVGGAIERSDRTDFPNFSRFVDYGCYLELNQSKQRPGVVVVPIR